MKIFRKLDKKKFFLLNVLFLFIFIAIFVPQKVLALDIPHILSGLLMPIISGFGKLLTVLINLLITVAQYNNFINSSAVSHGWIIIRDVCNMFFIIVLLVIAFATVLKIEKYSYKRLLGGFLLAAVLVNFSKLVCGVLIDASQILMLTFVKAFSAAAEGNFIKMLGLDKILTLNASDRIGDTEVVGALILGLIMFNFFSTATNNAVGVIVDNNVFIKSMKIKSEALVGLLVEYPTFDEIPLVHQTSQ